jgi:hypothetical protein
MANCRTRKSTGRDLRVRSTVQVHSHKVSRGICANVRVVGFQFTDSKRAYVFVVLMDSYYARVAKNRGAAKPVVSKK